jgi:hypothetical protein
MAPAAPLSGYQWTSGNNADGGNNDINIDHNNNLGGCSYLHLLFRPSEVILLKFLHRLQGALAMTSSQSEQHSSNQLQEHHHTGDHNISHTNSNVEAAHAQAGRGVGAGVAGESSYLPQLQAAIEQAAVDFPPAPQLPLLVTRMLRQLQRGGGDRSSRLLAAMLEQVGQTHTHLQARARKRTHTHTDSLGDSRLRPPRTHRRSHPYTDAGTRA